MIQFLKKTILFFYASAQAYKVNCPISQTGWMNLLKTRDDTDLTEPMIIYHDDDVDCD
jgi:hypothetical protein